VPSQQSVLLKAKGLYTFPNALSEIPQGSLTVADNVVIDRNGVIEPRRGFAEYGDTFGIASDRAKQLLVYKNRIIRHFQSTLQYDNGSGTFTSFNGTYAETETGRRMRGIEANGNLYFTTSAGIKRISATSASGFTNAAGYIRNAGGVGALDVTGAINYTTAGFFINPNYTSGNGYAKAAYRITWAYKDANSNLIEGSPSSRLIVTNYASDQSGSVDLSFAIPPDIGTTDTQFYYRIYRTQVVGASTVAGLADVEPGDEMNLVIEAFPSAAQLVARLVTVNDPTPEDFRAGGELLYTNPVSGDGILQANEAPPLAKDVTLFQNTLFFANTQTIQNLNLALLGLASLTSNTSTLTITDGTTSNTYTFRGLNEIATFTFDTQAATTNRGYCLLSSASNARKYFFWMDKTGTAAVPSAADTAGRIPVRCNISAAATAADVAEVFKVAINTTSDFTAVRLGAVVTVTWSDNGNLTAPSNSAITPVGGVFAIAVTQVGLGEDQATKKVLLSGLSSPSQAIDETARSLVNIINNNSGEIVNAFYLSGPDDVPGLILLKARSLAGAAFHVTANSTATGGEFSPVLPTSGSTVISTNEVEPNALWYSKFQQPDAVPIENKFNVGPKDKKILRILPLRDSLFVLKEDGIYRVTGQAGSFTLDPFDYSAICIAPDSAVVLNNQIYMLSSQGIVTISDTGVSVISRPIEGILDRLTSTNFNYQFTTWGLAYESDRAYHIWLVTNTSDTVATQGFRFNTFTNSWTRSTNSKVCGTVNPFDGKLYLGPGDQNFIEKERKDFLRTDYADREISLSIPVNGVTTTTVTLSSNAQVEDGDTLVQTQYLTINQFNQLLQKLDLDPVPTFHDYYTRFGASPGVAFRNVLNNLATRLDADTGLGNSSGTTFSSAMSPGSTFVDFQNDYNAIVNKLNSFTNILHPNFRLSSGTIAIETPIAALGSVTNSVTVTFAAPFIQGAITLIKGIKADVVWAPQTFGDPSILKQVREGTLLFEDTVYYSAQVGYASDLSPDYEYVSFDESGIGDWGLFVWGGQNWGGNGSSVPLRTYIPRNKQHCRFLRPRFKHGIAREKFALFGLSLTFRALSERAYRG
jgi:hypothetical protein